MKRVASSTPTPCSLLAWNGTLTRLEMGFDSSFARASASSSPAPGCEAGVAVVLQAVAGGYFCRGVMSTVTLLMLPLKRNGGV